VSCVRVFLGGGAVDKTQQRPAALVLPMRARLPPAGVLCAGCAALRPRAMRAPLLQPTPNHHQVTDMVEGELATAAREVPRFGSRSASGSSSSRRGGGLGAAAASRQAARYSRFDAEVRACVCFRGVAAAACTRRPCVAVCACRPACCALPKVAAVPPACMRASHTPAHTTPGGGHAARQRHLLR
jgi:hypothetical protein